MTARASFFNESGINATLYDCAATDTDSPRNSTPKEKSFILINYFFFLKTICSPSLSTIAAKKLRNIAYSPGW